jgi:SPP1 family predicted phage head-tail adaptor
MARDRRIFIGAARRRLVLEGPVPTPDDAGGAATTFAPLATLWASLRWLDGAERRSADRPEQAARQEIVIRWRAGVTAGMRFTGGGRTHGIMSVGDPVGDRVRLVCLCEEISP